MSWVESRVRLAESAIEDLYRRVLDLADKIKAVAQGLRAANQAVPGGQGGGASGGFVCVPSATIGPASGPPPSGTPASLPGQSIFQINGGTYTSLGTAAVLNASSTGSLAGGKLTFLAANPDGTYTGIGQAC